MSQDKTILKNVRKLAHWVGCKHPVLSSFWNITEEIWFTASSYIYAMQCCHHFNVFETEIKARFEWEGYTHTHTHPRMHTYTHTTPPPPPHTHTHTLQGNGTEDKDFKKRMSWKTDRNETRSWFQVVKRKSTDHCTLCGRMLFWTLRCLQKSGIAEKACKDEESLKGWWGLDERWS